MTDCATLIGMSGARHSITRTIMLRYNKRTLVRGRQTSCFVLPDAVWVGHSAR